VPTRTTLFQFNIKIIIQYNTDNSSFLAKALYRDLITLSTKIKRFFYNSQTNWATIAGSFFIFVIFVSLFYAQDKYDNAPVLHNHAVADFRNNDTIHAPAIYQYDPFQSDISPCKHQPEYAISYPISALA
jgi:hypothetical protein